MCWVSELDRARVRLGQDGQSLSERAGPSSGADRVRIQAQMTTLRYRRPSVIEPGRGGVFEFSERTPQLNSTAIVAGCARRSSRVDRELVSSLQGTLLQLKVRKQFRRGRTGLCFGRITGAWMREGTCAAREQKARRAERTPRATAPPCQGG